MKNGCCPTTFISMNRVYYNVSSIILWCIVRETFAGGHKYLYIYICVFWRRTEYNNNNNIIWVTLYILNFNPKDVTRVTRWLPNEIFVETRSLHALDRTRRPRRGFECILFIPRGYNNNNIYLRIEQTSAVFVSCKTCSSQTRQMSHIRDITTTSVCRFIL